MVQNLADLCQRSAVAEHMRGQTVAEQVCPFQRGIQPSPVQCTRDNSINSRGVAQAAVRRFRAQEHTAGTTAWTGLFQIGDDGLSDIFRQREPFSLRPFSAYIDLGRFPSDVFQLQR